MLLMPLGEAEASGRAQRPPRSGASPCSWQPRSPRTCSAVSASGTPRPLPMSPVERKPSRAVEGWGRARAHGLHRPRPPPLSPPPPRPLWPRAALHHGSGLQNHSVCSGDSPAPNPGGNRMQVSCSLPLLPASRIREVLHRPPALRGHHSDSRKMWFYQKLAFSPPVSAAPSHRGHEIRGWERLKGPTDMGCGGTDVGAACPRGDTDGQGWDEVGLSHLLAPG